jgi:hypothetical protein
MTAAKKFTLSDEMERKISALWASAHDRGRVRDALGGYAAESFGSERVPLAILKLCRGDVGRVLSLTAEARLDCRDILMAAEYPEQGDSLLATMQPGATEADRSRFKEAAQRDRKQYEEWRKK